MSDTPRRKQGVPTATSIGYAANPSGKTGKANNGGKFDPREVVASPATVQGFAPLSAEEMEGTPTGRAPLGGTSALPMMESLRVRNPTATPLERPRIQMPPVEVPGARTTPAEFGPTQVNPRTLEHPQSAQQVPRPRDPVPAATQQNPRTFLHGHINAPAQPRAQAPLARADSPVPPQPRLPATDPLPPAARAEGVAPAGARPGTTAKRPLPGGQRSHTQVPITPEEAKTTVFQRPPRDVITDEVVPPLRRIQRWWFLLPIAPLTFVFAYLVFGAPEPEPPAPLSSAGQAASAALPADRSALVERGTMEVSLRAEGRVLGGVGTEIRPEAPGVVAAVYVKDGQTVKEGDPLVSFDGASLRKQLQAASQIITDRKAELTVQRLRRDAVRRDMNSGLLWPAEMEAAEAEVGRAEGRLKSAVAARRRLEERGRAGSLTAPAGGVVRDLTVKVGDRLTPGRNQEAPALMIIEEPGKLAIEADLAPEIASKVTVGARARVTLGEAAGKALEGSITALPPEVVKTAAGTEIRRAELLIDAGPGASEIAPGTNASVRLPGEKKPGVLLVPAAAVTTDNAGASVEVWSPAEQHYERRVVQTGATDDTHVEVLNNLSPGDRVRLPGKI